MIEIEYSLRAEWWIVPLYVGAIFGGIWVLTTALYAAYRWIDRRFDR